MNKDTQYLTSEVRVASPSTTHILQWCETVLVKERCPKGGDQLGQRDPLDKIRTYSLYNTLIVHWAQDSEDLDDKVQRPG